MLISEKFNLNYTQESMDMVDVNLSGDAKIFVDPTMLRNSTYPELRNNGLNKVNSFFKEVFRLYESGEKQTALNSLFNSSKEINAFHIGYSGGKSNGKGVSRRALEELFDMIEKSGNLSEDMFSNPVSMTIFTKGFGEDRMSDLVVSILKKEFVEYTLTLARNYGIRIEKNKIEYGSYWDDSTKCWKKLSQNWVDDGTGNPVIFVPKQIVKEKYEYSVNEYLWKIIIEYRQSKHTTNQSKFYDKYQKKGRLSKKSIYDNEIPELVGADWGKTKRYILRITLEEPGLLKQYLNFKLENSLNTKGRCLSSEELAKIVSSSYEN